MLLASNELPPGCPRQPRTPSSGAAIRVSPGQTHHQTHKGVTAMSHYKSNVRDIEFNLFELLGLQEKLGKGIFEEMDEDTVRSILQEVERLATNDLAASFVEA